MVKVLWMGAGAGGVFTKRFCRLNWLGGAKGIRGRAMTINQSRARQLGGIHRPSVLVIRKTMTARNAACSERFTTASNHAGAPIKRQFIFWIGGGFSGAPSDPPR